MCAALLTGLFIGSIHAEDSALRDPLQLRNLSPLYHSLGIPMLRSAKTQDPGSLEAAYRLSWASHAMLERQDGEVFELDGETRRHEFSAAYGISDRLTVDLMIPWVVHEGGRLDSLIDSWHSFWGLPDGPREIQPRDRLLYSLDGEQPFLFEEDSDGLGDTEIGLSARLLGDSQWQLSGFLRFKLDTGDADDFTGSGDSGASVGLRWSTTRCIWSSLSCHGHIGLADIGRSPLDAAAEDQALFGGVSLAWAITDTVALIGQLEGHEVIYTAPALSGNGTPIWGSLGLRWQPSSRWALEASFAEDLQVGTAPDVTFQFGLRYR